uniref:Uncharacterized protein n=1 Tax=Anguilla anguilla TaxID=7936 RepID=A0A0E9VRA4_ANGAN
MFNRRAWLALNTDFCCSVCHSFILKALPQPVPFLEH